MRTIEINYFIIPTADYILIINKLYSHIVLMKWIKISNLFNLLGIEMIDRCFTRINCIFITVIILY